MLCLACGREAPDAPERILVARIGTSQEADMQAIRVCVLPGMAVYRAILGGPALCESLCACVASRTACRGQVWL